MLWTEVDILTETLNQFVEFPLSFYFRMSTRIWNWASLLNLYSHSDSIGLTMVSSLSAFSIQEQSLRCCLFLLFSTGWISSATVTVMSSCSLSCCSDSGSCSSFISSSSGGGSRLDFGSSTIECVGSAGLGWTLRYVVVISVYRMINHAKNLLKLMDIIVRWWLLKTSLLLSTNFRQILTNHSFMKSWKYCVFI